MTPTINKDIERIDLFIHFATIAGTISLIYLINYLFKIKNKTSITQIGTLKLHRSNLIIACYNFIVVGIFSIIYYYISNFTTIQHFKIHGKPIKLTMLEAIYVSLVTQTTVGYGHVTYESYWVELLNIIQMISILLNITFIHF
tara:strand:- start:1996 stop:2424 length:429 start_codon:yes stop_codon:yes gene_type:complete